jgi:HPt (histidine-containing phosphotransfer) domain-containing protein
MTGETSTHGPPRPRRSVQTTSRARRVVSDAPARAAGSQEPSQLLDSAVRRSAQVSRLFIELVPAQLEGLLVATREEATDQLKTRAHKLKGGCVSVGARPMSELCQALEEATALHDLTATRQHVEALHAVFEETAALLRAELLVGARAS